MARTKDEVEEEAVVAEIERWADCSVCNHSRRLSEDGTVVVGHNEYNYSTGQMAWCEGSYQCPADNVASAADDTIAELAYHSAGGSSAQTIWSG